MESKHILELALIRGVPDFCLDKNMKKGRLKKLFKKLVKAVDKELSSIKSLNRAFLLSAEATLNGFSERVGWQKNRHIMTHISFLLLMCEESDYNYNKKIIELLNDISDYFERVGNHPIKSNYSAEMAVDVWKTIK